MDETNLNPNPELTAAPTSPAPTSPAPTPEPPINSKVDVGAFLKENKWAILLITGSLLVIAGALYFTLRKPKDNTPSQPKVSIGIEAPDKISSGSEIIYKLHVKNNDTTTIKKINVDIVYPNGFSFIDSTPKATKLNGSQFGLPALDPSQDVIVMIKGSIQGNAGETKTISATMHYQLENFNSDFVAQTQAQSQITTADLALQFDGENNVNPEQQKTYTLNYANYTSASISDFRITLTTPTNFAISGIDPKAAFGSTYTLGTLAPNASGKITITGTFKNVNGGDRQIFTAKAEGSVDGKPNYVLSAGQLEVTIAQVPLQAYLVLNNLSKNNSVMPGDTLEYKVIYKNNGSAPASGVILTVKLNGDSLDLSHISANGADVQNNTITWDGSQNEGLASIGAGSGGSFDFTVPVRNPASRTNEKNLTIAAHTEMKSKEYTQAFVGSELSVKVETVVDISKSVSYSSGSQPPSPGRNTIYNVSIILKNQTNDVTGGKMTFTLPSAVNFSTAAINSEERDNVAFDANIKKLTWTVGTLAAHAGSFVPLRKLQFNISVTPSITLKGSPITLVNNIKFSGTDSFTTTPIALNGDPILSSDDPSGQGFVQ